jgi:hypothetical protein
MGHDVSGAQLIPDLFLIFGDVREIRVRPVVIRPQVHCQHGAAASVASGGCRRRKGHRCPSRRRLRS